MLKILKNLKQSWVIVVVIIILLCVQATADLNLPDYTSKIVNIGIQQKGIQNSAPEVISKQTLEKVLLLSKEDDFIQIGGYKIIAKEKWEIDKKHIEFAKQKNYIIYEIWEHDIVSRNDSELIQFMYNLLNN